MKTLYEGTRNKLDYVVIKLSNKVHDFYVNNIKDERFTPDVDAVERLAEEISEVEAMVYGDSNINWDLVKKYTALADEFRCKRGLL